MKTNRQLILLQSDVYLYIYIYPDKFKVIKPNSLDTTFKVNELFSSTVFYRSISSVLGNKIGKMAHCNILLVTEKESKQVTANLCTRSCSTIHVLPLKFYLTNMKRLV